MGAQQSSEDNAFMASTAEVHQAGTRAEAKGTEAANQASQNSLKSSIEDHEITDTQAGAAQPDSSRDGDTAAAADPPKAEAESKTDSQGDDDEDDEEGCAFCKFMKGGGCKAEFVAWEKCVADSRESGDFVGQCADITEALQACMNHPDHKDYYQLFLDDQEEYVREQREKDQQEAETQEAETGSEQGSNISGFQPNETQTEAESK